MCVDRLSRLFNQKNYKTNNFKFFTILNGIIY